MTQIILNYLMIFILPFLAGILLRSLFRKKARGWIVTVIAAVFALVTSIVAFTVPSHGSEVNGILMYQAICLLVGVLLAAGIIRLRHRQK